jgi:hypothetical protein
MKNVPGGASGSVRLLQHGHGYRDSTPRTPVPVSRPSWSHRSNGDRHSHSVRLFAGFYGEQLDLSSSCSAPVRARSDKCLQHRKETEAEYPPGVLWSESEPDEQRAKFQRKRRQDASKLRVRATVDQSDRRALTPPEVEAPQSKPCHDPEDSHRDERFRRSGGRGCSDDRQSEPEQRIDSARGRAVEPPHSDLYLVLICLHFVAC